MTGGYTVDPGVVLSYRPARLHRMAGRYDKPTPDSTICPSQGLRIWPLQSRRPESARRRLLEKIEAARILIKHKMFQVNNLIIQRCGSGSARINIIMCRIRIWISIQGLPIRIRIYFNQMYSWTRLFFRKLQYIVQKIENCIHITLKRKMKQCTSILTLLTLSNLCKPWGYNPRIRTWIGIEMESRIRIGVKTRRSTTLILS